jgi:drug/metabolite transporter (DMT)-like permease
MHTKSLDHKAIIRRTYAAFIATIILGGFNAIAIHYVVAEVPPFWGATLRFAPAAALLFLFALVRRLPLPRGRALLGAVIYGVLQFGVTFALQILSR